MRKKMTPLIGISAILFILFIPYAAAVPQVYLNAGDTIIWHQQVTAESDMESGYLKMNVSAVDEFTDKIFVNFSAYNAKEEDYNTYGWENHSIWDSGLSPDEEFGYLNDSMPETHYKYFFNEQNSAISSIPTDVLSQVSLLADPAVIAYALIVGLGVGFGAYTENVTSNSTTIIEATSRSISFEFEIFAGLGVVANPGEWFNMSVSSHQKWIYGAESNVLLGSLVNSTITVTEYNETSAAYQVETLTYGINVSAIYPQWLVDDIPIEDNPFGNIPGYPFIFFGFASIAGVFFILKRKMK